MKKIFLALLFIVVNHVMYAQAFEGKIIYSNTYISKSAAIPVDKLASMMGTIQNYYIKGGQYKSETNGSFVLWQIYINADNKLYSKLSNSTAIMWNDGTENNDEVLSSETAKNTDTILGYKCDKVILHCKSGTQTYYYSAKLLIDAALFKNHLYGNWYDYLKIAGAVPLKTVVENAQFTLESVATSIKSEKLDDSIFRLPADAQKIKNPYQ